MDRLLGRGWGSVELPSRLSPVLAFWPGCLLELVLLVRRGLSVGATRGAGPLPRGRGMSELLGWDWPRHREFRERCRPVTEMLHRD
jgi:hypothetical protein